MKLTTAVVALMEVHQTHKRPTKSTTTVRELIVALLEAVDEISNLDAGVRVKVVMPSGADGKDGKDSNLPNPLSDADCEIGEVDVFNGRVVLLTHSDGLRALNATL